jgi:hypothetical protein
MEPYKNSADAKMKMINKLMLQSQQIQQNNIKEEKDKSFKSVKERMNNAYQKNKRQKKIDKLQAIQTHWKGLN